MRNVEDLCKTNDRLLDKYRGCLVGGAVGDALGYAVEFMSLDSIKKKYGDGGIREYALSGGIARISDDTQMTLFTANGLLLGVTCETVESYSENIARCYLDWFITQTEGYPVREKDVSSWLINDKRLFSCRAPGNTCLSALEMMANGRKRGSVADPINKSKGCGGVMRVAPIGLYFMGEEYTSEEIDMIAAEAAAITHGHELGYIPAAALAHIIHIVSHETDADLYEAIESSLNAVCSMFEKTQELDSFVKLMKLAVKLSESEISDEEAIRTLGEGWVGDEALAIAVFCALRYRESFEDAMVASVNHDGDSDSTGAIAGNILGAYLGMSAIPQKYLDNLELMDVMIEISDDLYNAKKTKELGSCEDKKWKKKYVDMTYTVK